MESPTSVGQFDLRGLRQNYGKLVNTINLPALSAGLFWRKGQLYNGGSIRVSLVPGTYAEWQAAFGTGTFTADDDGDGVPNAVEFLLATNPHASFAAGDFPLVELPTTTSAIDRTARATFQIPEDPAEDAHYRLQASSDLVVGTRSRAKTAAVRGLERRA